MDNCMIFFFSFFYYSLFFFCLRFVSFLLCSEACSHGRSHQFFAASIFPDNIFTGYPCSSYETYKAGQCKKKNGIRMGEPVPNTARGVYYLETSDTSPFAQGR